MIQEFEFYHGAVLASLVHFANRDIRLKLYATNSNSSYVLNESVGIYIKYSSKRLSPWRFVFNETHLHELQEMKTSLKELYLVLVCGTDGIVSLDNSEIKSLINHTILESKWLSAARVARKEYTVKSSDGILNYKIAKSDFPKKILEAKALNYFREK
jgi:hypothetical protein